MINVKKVMREAKRDTTVEEQLLDLLKKQYSPNGTAAVKYETINLNSQERLIRIRSNDEITTLHYRIFLFGESENERIFGVHGELLKSNGEYSSFQNKIRVEGNTKEEVLFTEDNLVEVQGFWVDTDGKVTEFRDRSPDYDETGSNGCKSCGSANGLFDRAISFIGLQRSKAPKLRPALAWNNIGYGETDKLGSRKIGPNRCWLCTSIALVIGFFVTGLVTWLSPYILSSFGIVETNNLNFQILAFLIGGAYTLWRAT